MERTREQVKILDELYKNAVVSITKRYDGPPAIKVAMDVFAAMEKSGRHKAKLVGANDSPQNEANLPKTDFEKAPPRRSSKGNLTMTRSPAPATNALSSPRQSFRPS